jgi:hypothetical protein
LPAELPSELFKLSDDEVLELYAARFEQQMTFATYLEVVSEWSDWWTRTHGQRPPDECFTEPFRL